MSRRRFLLPQPCHAISTRAVIATLGVRGQADSAVSRKFEGTGLGLPLSKSLVELHGRSFDLQSEVGVGTTVTVRLSAERIVSEVQVANQSVDLRQCRAGPKM